MSEKQLNSKQFFFCNSCERLVTCENKELESCIICKNDVCQFFHICIASQIKSIIEKSIDSLDFSINSGSEIHRKIKQNFAKFITLTINTDGMSIFKSSKTSIWPIYLTINQIKKNERFKLANVIVAGLWVSKYKPNFHFFLKPIINQLKILKNGLVIGDKILRFFLTHGVFDKPARAAILNTVQYNGKFGCLKCYQPGQNIKSAKNGNIRVYPYQNYHYDRPKRTHDKYVFDVEKAIKENNVIRGIKGSCLLSDLKFYFPIESTVIDYMHSILEGVVKSLIKYWFDEKYSNRSSSLRKYLKNIDKSLVKIKVPSFIPRSPRSLLEIVKWKANEFFSFLFYYSLPLFRWIMPLGQLNHMINLVVAIENLLQPNLNVEYLDDINCLLKDFVRDMEFYYGLDTMLSGVHELIHITSDIKNNGSINELNCFAFEDMNRQVVNFIKAKNHTGVQIINSLKILKLFNYQMCSLDKNVKEDIFSWSKRFNHDWVYGRNLNKNILNCKIRVGLEQNFFDLRDDFNVTDYVRKKDIFYTSTNYKKVKSSNYCVEINGKFCIIICFCYNQKKCVAICQVLSKLIQPFYNEKFKHLKSSIIMCTLSDQYLIEEIYNLKKCFLLEHEEIYYVSNFSSSHILN
ncbi:hypothetical protein BpHYR1_010421 [Brachionus plicatilis]|uniref:Transposase domain-containing protein n=1 Tax=Brachionus plicatilis TaxID=10195 RepID=A0A3M7PI27_BRAPC|nr:hypothetical protein BpHYR1_010421 [Brachionus plicatilis]